MYKQQKKLKEIALTYFQKSWIPLKFYKNPTKTSITYFYNFKWKLIDYNRKNLSIWNTCFPQFWRSCVCDVVNVHYKNILDFPAIVMEPKTTSFPGPSLLHSSQTRCFIVLIKLKLALQTKLLIGMDFLKKYIGVNRKCNFFLCKGSKNSLRGRS